MPIFYIAYRAVFLFIIAITIIPTRFTAAAHS